jgi:hypothetical protein
MAKTRPFSQSSLEVIVTAGIILEVFFITMVSVVCDTLLTPKWERFTKLGYLASVLI